MGSIKTIKKIVKAILPTLATDVIAAARLYRKAHGRYPNLLFPRRFTEKVMRRSLFDKRPVLRQFADKFTIRTYVESKIGSRTLAKQYCATGDPAEIPFDALPDRFVVKPTHGAGWVRVVKDKAQIDRQALIEQCAFWLSQDFYEVCRERVYQGLCRRILVEEFIDDGTKGGPVDYKFFVFHGKVHLIQIIADRFGDIRVHHLDRAWNRLDLNSNYEPFPGLPAQPPHLAEMIAAAETLGRGIDFVRADFYDTKEKFYFGELTTTPSAGLDRFNPDHFDVYFGSLW